MTKNRIPKNEIIKMLQVTPKDQVQAFSPVSKQSLKGVIRNAEAELRKASYVSIVVIHHE